MEKKKQPEGFREGEEVLYRARLHWTMLIPWLAPSGFLLMGSLSAALVVAPGIAVLARQFFSTEEMLVTNLRVMKKREGRWDMRPDPDRPRPTRGRYIASATPEIP